MFEIRKQLCGKRDEGGDAGQDNKGGNGGGSGLKRAARVPIKGLIAKKIVMWNQWSLFREI